MKKEDFHWDEEQQTAFCKLKSIAMSDVVLAFPTYDGQFILDTDASDVAGRAELLQLQEGMDRPLAFPAKP